MSTSEQSGGPSPSQQQGEEAVSSESAVASSLAKSPSYDSHKRTGVALSLRWWQVGLVVLVASSLRVSLFTTSKIGNYYSGSSDDFYQKFVQSIVQTKMTTNSAIKRGDDHNNATATTSASGPRRRLALIPKPTRLKQLEGSFLVTASSKICVSDEDVVPEAELLAETLRASTGFQLPIGNGCEQGQICLMLLEEDEKKGKELFQKAEAYVLDVRDAGCVVGAFTRQGIFYGTQTLLQLLPAAAYRSEAVTGSSVEWSIPLVHIEDAPQFQWRGMHLDSARHFMPKEFVFKLINLLAVHKLNSFHMHLTEDQGWRLEIKQYPLLTNISAWRSETLIGHNDAHKYERSRRRYDGTRHGGFYTQDDIREIVAYAARRHINVVPEIEMPGHSQEVFAAYPQYSCNPDKQYIVKREWGVSDEVFCAGNDDTFTFLQNILDEVMAIFPSPYIHIGGDECPKHRWHTCPKCQQRMRDEGLKDTKELQSYFIKRIEKFLNARGRKLIGWDEIFQGGLAPHAAVMSWRGAKPATKAAELGHEAILAPVGETYFDWYQVENKTGEPLAWGGHTPLQKVYNLEPIDPSLSKDKHHLILGAQAQLWTEYMTTTQQVEYQAFPRVAALAEAVWRKPKGHHDASGDDGGYDSNSQRDYADFYARLMHGHLPRLDALKVNYRRPKGPVE